MYNRHKFLTLLRGKADLTHGELLNRCSDNWVFNCGDINKNLDGYSKATEMIRFIVGHAPPTYPGGPTGMRLRIENTYRKPRHTNGLEFITRNYTKVWLYGMILGNSFVFHHVTGYRRFLSVASSEDDLEEILAMVELLK